MVVVGISATSNLLYTAKASTDTSTAASGVSGVMSPLWLIFGFGILIIGVYCVIHAYTNM